ncbi:heterokaryon incompatibility protein-domain-containing protein [Lophiotrema nucula]|uniref:Heterokaryon incompatibility protein-domain-containing protein n=1 Tax=Lophiotrema nucula TaxID=690887 RepID=A0A6A5YP24_9PLEO|nr:heterokaryon incompatibility protein-domain-containing protein [Lophiotrema nucula]
MNLPPFQYEPLPDGSIRLLKVQEDVSGGHIRGELITEEFTNDLQFYALSYVWGSATCSHAIACNGSNFPVTENLHEALFALSPVLNTNQLPIWIDAICINQRDYDEKAREVQRMDEIYRKAKLVLVWLGPEDKDSNLAMRHIEEFAKILPGIERPPHWRDLATYDLPSKDDPVWPAIGHLYRRNWFGRLWTFQEAVLATQLRVYCGRESVEWELLALVGSELNRTQLFCLAIRSTEIAATQDGFRAVADVSWAKRFRKLVGDDLARLEAKLDPESVEGVAYSQDHAHVPFASLLQVSQDRLCADIRDRVYGMMSLTSEEFRRHIPISYSRGLRQLYIDTGKACMEQDRSLTYLQMVAGKPRSDDLPSWCSNLSHAIVEILPFDVYLRAGHLMEEGRTRKASIKIVPDEDYIEIIGFRADRVASVVPPGGSFRTGPMMDREKRRHAWLQKCHQLAESTQHLRPDADLTLDHVYAITANTISRVRDGEALRLSLQDNMLYIESQSKGLFAEELYRSPKERMQLFTDTTDQLYRSCSGRSYFTTTSGRVGLGPPEVLAGDIIVVFYGTRPAFLLRERGAGEAFEFVGDAFVHGFMELSRTPKSDIGEDEVFRII